MRFMFTAFITLVLKISLWSNMGPQGFHAHLNRYFVETGSFGGDGIQKALDAGFQEIHSLDIDPLCVKNCKMRFLRNPKVHIWLKDSGKELFQVIAPLKEGNITFWLDGHNGIADPKGGKNTPLLEELEQIKHHPIKTHTILIDDLHCCDTILFDFITKEEIINKVLEINPNYIITFEPGGNLGEYPKNVLVAKPPKNS